MVEDVFSGLEPVEEGRSEPALLLTIIGVVCSLAAAMAVTRLMSALLFQISPLDPVTYLAVPMVLVAAALLASYVPARRATAIDPIDALRVE